MKSALRAVVATALAVLSAQPLVAQDSASVHRAENERLGYGELRPGADGNDPDAPNAANFDEDRVGNLSVPSLFRDDNGAAEGWSARRAELARLIENEWVGRVPESAREIEIVWTKQEVDDGDQWLGQLMRPGYPMGPTIDARLSLPPQARRAGSRPVPVVIEYSYIWPPDFRFPGPPAPSLREAALARGWGHVAYRPTLLQADDTALLSQGLIGMTAWPRGEHDWGALRAWAWGASRLREALAADPLIDGSRIVLAGHSRFGKAVLVAAAFDHEFADALVSSSGAGGAKLMRRDFGERLENMADPYASVWYAPRIKHYAGNASLEQWPVDAHMLIALRAPRPLLISTGTVAQGDGWTDPAGQWQATLLARAAWRATGADTFPDEARPQPGHGPLETPLAFYQHAEGHVMWPAFEALFNHTERFTR
ncbi:alpha/beta hydrolase family protein [Aurantiacibacter hainanensis]|uniref:alpha/beta hydrolase family protein n=1 Tax=Aurantiacibacter hainanensis TaxID=3076114 RepID=UPI0030C714AB